MGPMSGTQVREVNFPELKRNPMSYRIVLYIMSHETLEKDYSFFFFLILVCFTNYVIYHNISSFFIENKTSRLLFISDAVHAQTYRHHIFILYAHIMCVFFFAIKIIYKQKSFCRGCLKGNNNNTYHESYVDMRNRKLDGDSQV